jgi:uncharacterized RDD family membrane protein YckC
LAGATVGVVSPHAGVGAIAYVINPIYAGFWLRFAAYLIDRIILGVSTALLMVPLFVLGGGLSLWSRIPRGRIDDFSQWIPLLTLILTLAAISLVVQWLYFASFESGEQQGTWGKQIMSIYVSDLQGNRISFGGATARYFAKIVTGLIPFGLGFIMAGFNERRQALHDMIASTLVLRR